MWRRLMMLIMLILIQVMGLDSCQLVSSSKEDNFRFSNCNNTDVPIYFKNITVRPDPLVILTEQWPINVTFDILVMKNITRMEVSFSLTLWTDEGNTELCYLLGDLCYVPDGCKYVNGNALATGIHCPLYPGIYNKSLSLSFPPLPFIVRGKYTVHMSLREEGIPLGCLEFTICLNQCDYNAH